MSEQFSNQSSMLNRIRNNNFINVSKLTPMIIKDIGTFSPDAQRYLRLPTMILGTHEVRARLGNFRNPWMSPVPDWYAPYPFKFSSVTYWTKKIFHFQLNLNLIIILILVQLIFKIIFCTLQLKIILIVI